MTNKQKAQELVAQMTLEEKASLCSGSDCWHTKSIERLGINSILMSDGPHGLRKQDGEQDNLGIGKSFPATCFPTASLLACSFDPSLAESVGKAIAEECLLEDVSIVLGPGINMKRSSLCGRNFEYFSEDSLLSGKMASGMINGIQSKGVAASLKHFAVNNQEKRRMSVSAVVDERALHETYLKAFEIAVKESKPRTVMCSYNKINGTYSSENKELLTDILRKKWGYDGLVVSDWGAVHNRDEGIAAGLDLEMPGSLGVNDRRIVAAVKNGTLSESDLDKAAINVVKLVLDSEENLAKVDESFKSKATEIRQKNHELSIKAAKESVVLLKNEDNILPLTKNLSEDEIAIVNPFGEKPRFQGAGSSKINPIKVEQIGEHIKGTASVENAKVVIVFAGLTEKYESEGFDRPDLSMPKEHCELIEEVASKNKNVVVVLLGGAPFELTWESKVKGILLAYLGGEGVMSAVADVLKGKDSPCGKLAETWPLKAEDMPSFKNFPGDRQNVIYKESIFTGYKFYDTAKVPVKYMFGHGLSYTSFVYSNIRISKTECAFKEKLELLVDVTNTGKFDAKETILVFVNHKNEKVFMPEKQLVGFNKVFVKSGETKTVNVEIDTKNFAYYNVLCKDWYAESGDYTLFVGGSLESSVKNKVVVKLVSPATEEPNYSQSAKSYFELKPNMDFDTTEFESILGRKVPPKAEPPRRPFTRESCLKDTTCTLAGRIMYKFAVKYMTNESAREEDQDLMMIATIKEMPLFALQASSNGVISENQLNALIELINGHIFKAIKLFFTKTA